MNWFLLFVLFVMLGESLRAEISILASSFSDIDNERKSKLEDVSNKIKEMMGDEPVLVCVICTHNSRRSQIGQLWLAAAAEYYSIDSILAYSGGTEATAFHPNAVKAMKSFGFPILATGATMEAESNIVYSCNIKQSPTLFSKQFRHPSNPQKEFIAILVCDQADEACPYVPGAKARFFIPFEDPKHSDNSADTEKVYRKAAATIGRDFLFLASNIKD